MKFTLIVLAAFVTVNIVLADNIDKDATIQSITSQINVDGTYQYQYDTSNGIAVQESGAGGLYAQGYSSHYAPDGQLIQLSYVSDETGFHPKGEHLPTPPPIPDYILRALEYIRTHPNQENRTGGSQNKRRF